MKLSEFEKRLTQHGKDIKNHIEPPFNIESEDLTMTKKQITKSKILVIATAVVCILGTTVFAAYKYFNAQQVAEVLGNSKLAEHFKDNKFVSETITDGAYKATILGITTGNNISDFWSSTWDVIPERTYAVVAIEKTNGDAITYDDEILVTPLIEGLNPWQYNIFTMNGGYSAQIIDGILYRILEFDNIEIFADRQVYIGVIDNTFYDTNAFNYDEKTGLISTNEDYNGTNILFNLELDKSKATPEKAEKYIEEINKAFNGDEGNENYDITDENDIDDDDAESQTEVMEIYIEEDDDGNLVTYSK